MCDIYLAGLSVLTDKHLLLECYHAWSLVFELRACRWCRWPPKANDTQLFVPILQAEDRYSVSVDTHHICQAKVQAPDHILSYDGSRHPGLRGYSLNNRLGETLASISAKRHSRVEVTKRGCLHGNHSGGRRMGRNAMRRILKVGGMLGTDRFDIEAGKLRRLSP